MNRKRRYFIVGAGGTGGSIAGYLTKAGYDVTVAARGEQLAAMRECGLRIQRPGGSFTVHPEVTTTDTYHGEADVIFVCVKRYSLDAVIPFLKRIAASDTVIIPILNVYGTGRYLQSQLPDKLVTDGCIYIAAQIASPGTILLKGDIFKIYFGIPGLHQNDPLLKNVEQDLRCAGIHSVLSDQIQHDTMMKYTYISPNATCGLYYDVRVGEIQKPGEIQDCFITLIRELTSVAEDMGIQFQEDMVKKNLKILKSLSPDASTSMQRDLWDGKPSEIDGLIFQVIRMADQTGTEIPMYRHIVNQLQQRMK